MLCDLKIENFAIIEDLELTFNPGLTTFTGETGAGKSIIIDAVETLLGGRAESTMIRSGAERAHLEASFQIPPQIKDQINAILESEELLDDPNYLILSREIRTNGRNLARINGHIVSLGLLRQISNHLVDIHGQSEHLSLLDIRHHQALLDTYAGVENLRSAYSIIYKQLASVRRNLEELRRSESESARMADLLKYQINEIESSRLKTGEEEDLLAERTRLVNAEGLASLTQRLLFALDEGTPESQSTIDLFGEVLEAANDLMKIDPSLSNVSGVVQDISERLNELAGEIRAYAEGIEYNPTRLDQVEERINLIHNLKRKYGNSISEINAFAQNARSQLENIIHAEEKIEALEVQQNEFLSKLGEHAWELSQQRRQAADQLRSELENELVELQMSGAQFQAKIIHKPDPQGVPIPDGRRISFDPTGIDQIEFLIAPNPGEGFKPLVQIASGGETSRLMLATKNVLARADQVPILVFDEIDQGIGGRVGALIGQKLWRLARFHQVLCITHLPQLAVYGDQHFQVKKQVQAGRTITQVEELHGDARLYELAQMLGDISDGTLQSAREMLITTGETTKS
ncbi:MAG: DNA repair protein RecN [Anaerolineales bacterium]|nr:DNA repair protein RecN [Anaerolineales bacterium]